VKLFLNCKFCKKSNKLNPTASDRYELSKKIGTNFKFACNHCKLIDEYHVNSVHSSKGINSKVLLIFLLIGSIFVFVSLSKFLDSRNIQSVYLLPIGLAILPMVYFAWFSNEEKKIRNFNRYKL